MKKVIAITILYLLYLGCKNQTVEYFYGYSENKKDIDSTFMKAFLSKIDSSKMIPSFGCISGFYGEISDEYTVEFSHSLTKYNAEYCLDTIHFDNENKDLCLISVFKKGEANLHNICTDIILIGDVPKPMIKVEPESGKIICLYKRYEEIEDYLEENILYIYIDHLTFKFNGKIVEIKDKWMWQMKDLGTSG